jgi:hypothetical protein
MASRSNLFVRHAIKIYIIKIEQELTVREVLHGCTSRTCCVTLKSVCYFTSNLFDSDYNIYK